MDRTISFAALVFAFAALWLPLGQYPFLIEHWMKVGTFMAPFLLLVALSFRKEVGEVVRMFAVLLLLAYIVHQFEEHWIDIYGRIYAFQGTVNELLLSAPGFPESDVTVLTPASGFVINTSLVWLVAALAIWAGPDHPFPTLAMASIVLVNAASHITSAVLGGAYNPGLLTSVGLFLPLSLFVYVRCFMIGAGSFLQILASLLWGILVYFVVLVARSALPRFLFRDSQVSD